tara:strand:+ start:1137 stop:1535 length:399 start_codon:yes stop_codon:yes gene_type:complete
MAQWKYYDAGIGNVGSYQASGHPWLSGSIAMPSPGEIKIDFPYVTKSITVAQSGSGNLRVHFVPTGSMNAPVDGGCFWQLDSDEDAITLNVKCAHLYLSAAPGGNPGFQVLAELTRIDKNRMFALTGSGISK